MRCPFCTHEETQVVETRESDEGDVIRRRRRCTHCDKRFTTYERPEIALPQVVKKDGARAEFAEGKLRASMMLALRKRPVSVEQVDAAVERIKDKLLGSGAKSDADFLPADQAFAFSAESASRDRVQLRWDIADDYYLYRDKVTVKTTAAVR